MLPFVAQSTKQKDNLYSTECERFTPYACWIVGCYQLVKHLGYLNSVVGFWYALFAYVVYCVCVDVLLSTFMQLRIPSAYTVILKLLASDTVAIVRYVDNLNGQDRLYLHERTKLCSSQARQLRMCINESLCCLSVSLLTCVTTEHNGIPFIWAHDPLSRNFVISYKHICFSSVSPT